MPSLSQSGPPETARHGRPSVHAPRPGALVAGKYKLVELLGEGAMASVFRASREGAPDVAIKLLHEEVGADATLAGRFRREARTAELLEHPSIVRLHEFGEDQGRLFMVMELLAGRDLFDLLSKEGSLPEDRAVSVAMQVCDALEAAHAVGVVHRDLKPENIFLVGGDEDHVKVVDFGIAKLLEQAEATDEDEVLTVIGTVVGTPEYMSPEQCSGAPVDARTDLYSLGVVLFQMLTCRLPFEGGTPVQLALRQMRELAPRLELFVPGVDPALAQLIARCLEKDPASRFGSAAELREALRPLRSLSASGQRWRSQKPMQRSPLRVQTSSTRSEIERLAATLDSHLPPSVPPPALPGPTPTPARLTPQVGPRVTEQLPEAESTWRLVVTAALIASVTAALAYWLVRP